MSDPVISARGLSRRFGDRLAVDALDLEVHAGEVVALLGHNGAGKTTTVRLLAGVLAATAGEATVLGLDPAREGPALRARIGVSTETPALDPRLTGRENLAFTARLFGADPARVDETLAQMGLAERADERIDRYSKGMRQRAALARALLHEPKLLFLDEPTSGLDPVAAHEVRSAIASLADQGRTIVLCTHNLPEAERICDRVLVLEQGRVIAQGTPAELAKTERVHLEIDAADREAAAAALAAAGVSFREERAATRSLESIYLELHEGRGA